MRRAWCSEHLRNRKGFSSNCDAYCQDGYLETAYSGQVRMLGNKTGYRGGKVEDLYRQGAVRNIATFHKSIVNAIYDNPSQDILFIKVLSLCQFYPTHLRSGFT